MAMAARGMERKAKQVAWGREGRQAGGSSGLQRKGHMAAGLVGPQ